MNKTGKQLVEEAIITGPLDETNIQQHGVDLNLVEVRKISGVGFIPNKANKGKTILAQRDLVKTVTANVQGEEIEAWELMPGSYDITLAQGCAIPANKRLKIIHRSSLFRNAGILVSALFDAGFETNRIGTIMVINNPVVIEYGARVGQAYTDESNVVENLYDGQFQNDKQRN